ncbi:MAG: SBBP repeat-containing protein, partial [Chloroflexota bacterium]
MRIIQEWLRDFNTTDNDEVLAFAADKDGNVYVTGYSEAVMVSAAQVDQMEIGEAVSSLLKRGIPPVRNSDELGGVANGKRGTSNIWLMKYAASGALEWKKELSLGVDGLWLRLEVDNDGDVILASRSDDQAPSLAKYGSRGNKRWSIEMDPAPNVLADIATDSEKNIYVAANKGADDAIAYFVAQYDSNGKMLNLIENAGAVDVISIDSEDNIVVSGEAPWGVFVGKMAPTLNGDIEEVWRRQLDAGHGEKVTAIDTDDSSSIYVTGVIDDENLSPEVEETRDVWLAKYSRDGQRQWYKRTTQSVAEDVSAALVVDDGGYVYVAGHTTGELVPGGTVGERDIWIAKYMPDGSELWRYQHGITDDDYCYGLALDAKGNIYIAG